MSLVGSSSIMGRGKYFVVAAVVIVVVPAGGSGSVSLVS